MKFVKGMSEQRQHRGEIFLHGFLAAGKRDCQRPADGSRQRAGKRGQRGMEQTVLEHGVFQTRQTALQKRQQRLGRRVAGSKAGAAAGQDKIVSLPKSEFRHQCPELRWFVREKEPLLMAEGKVLAHQFGQKWTTAIISLARSAFVGKGDPGQRPPWFAD